MTFNSKGFQPLMTLNSAHLRAVLRALARCHLLPFAAAHALITFISLAYTLLYSARSRSSLSFRSVIRLGRCSRRICRLGRYTY